MHDILYLYAYHSHKSVFSFPCLPVCSVSVFWSDLQPGMCLTERLMLYFFTSGLDPARLLNRTGQQGWTELQGGRDSKTARGKSLSFSYSEDEPVALSKTLTGAATKQHPCSHLLRSCQIPQEREALWSRLIFYMNWMESISFQWRDRHQPPPPGFHLF